MSLFVDIKYVGLASLRLEKFKKKGDRLFTFRCPYCGDSKKDKNKTRGYLYVNKDKVAFKCHNCSISASLHGFLNHVDASIANAYKLERYSNPINILEKAASAPKISNKPAINPNRLIDIGLIPLTQLPHDHIAIKYSTYRHLPIERYEDLYYAPDMRMIEKLSSLYEGRIASGERLIIPYYDPRGNLSGVTGRALDNNKMRYINIHLSDYSMIYGAKYLNTENPIYVVEGAFDSMFISNSIAVGGSDLRRAALAYPKQQLTLVFDNEPRNKSIVDIMQRMIQYQYKMVIWPPTWRYKDINEAIMNGVTKQEISQILYTNTHDNLALKLAIRDWKKC